MGTLKSEDWEKAVDTVKDLLESHTEDTGPTIETPLGDLSLGDLPVGDLFTATDLQVLVQNADLFLAFGRELLEVIYFKLRQGKLEEALELAADHMDAALVIKSLTSNAEEMLELIEESKRRKKFLKSLGKTTLYALIQVLTIVLA